MPALVTWKSMVPTSGMAHPLLSSCPALCRASTTLQAINEKDVDGIAIRALPDRVLFLMPEVGNIRLPVTSPAMTKES
ncbi:hypothetical protein [Bradyrhizobium sp. WD16]|uniref:hypothetical protein n=1 Tax=Bradyrhizobium sp. WD16 TaxID=1521768 RepID=UPI0020A3AD5A|nr:hypothetical protein [Bradyrhizobium sp. WD16]UTD26616.1 hypothetical protein DB459_06445 [Bradyrhizobium sp. WD16]